MRNPVSSAKRCSSTFQRRTREPLLPPPSVREKAQQEGNPLKAPMRHYPIKVALLSGLILCLRVVYCPADYGGKL